jgi:hypothetical protein
MRFRAFALGVWMLARGPFFCSRQPPYEQVVPKVQINAKVTNHLKKRTALAQYREGSIQPEQLLTEMNR